MAKPERYWTDERMDNLVGNLLRAGVILAAVVILTGAVLFLLKHGGDYSRHDVFHGVPRELRHFNIIIADALEWKGEAIIQLGLIILMATPVARVLLSAIIFALQRDRMYVVITLIVLALLLGSIFGLRF